MRQVVSYLYHITVVILPFFATAHGAEQTEAQGLSRCSKEEMMTFFPEIVVKSVLTQAKISESQTNAIAKELSHKDRELMEIVKEKAAQLNPNPFNDLNQRDVIIKIYRESLYEVFTKVLKSHGVTNEDQIHNLLDEMRTAKSKLFIDCIRQQRHSTEDADNL